MIVAIGIFIFLEHTKPNIQLSGYGMGNWSTFLVAAFSGIYLIMILARLILFSDLLTKILAFIGSKSFHIMALHFVGFKILTSMYIFFLGGEYYLISCYVIPQIPKFLYVIFGVCIPLIFCKIYSELIERRFS